MKPDLLDFYAKNKKDAPHPVPHFRNNYDSALFKYMEKATPDSRLFKLEHVINLDVFRNKKNKQKLREARDYLVVQGFCICFFAKDLDTHWGDCVHLLKLHEVDKVFLDQLDEETILTEYRDKRKSFSESGGIINVSCFDAREGWKKKYPAGKDEYGNTWFFHWEQIYNLWLREYYNNICAYLNMPSNLY